MANYDLLNQDGKIDNDNCETCLEGEEKKYHCEDCEDAIEKEKTKSNASILNTKKVSDLTVSELFDLMVKAVRECKRQDDEKAEIEYQKLTGGKVPKEW